MSTADRVRVMASYLGACLVMLGLALPTSASPSPLEESPAAMESFLDELMTEQLKVHAIPGATLAVVKDGQLLFAKGYGYANLERREPVIAEKTVFRVGSVAKLLTWTAVMQLVEQGRLDLDADINTYLHDFQIPATWAQPITLRHLLSHTAGFEEWRLPGEVLSANQLEPLGRVLTRYIPARVHPPGEVGAYSNYGASLAGYIVEQVSGLSFEQYIEKNILAPLDMHHTTFRQPLSPELAPLLATSYYVHGDIPRAAPFEYIRPAPAGSLSTTATDMAKFMVAHLQHGSYGERRILREDTTRRMHSLLFTYHPGLGGGAAYGFGLATVRGQKLLAHTGGTDLIQSVLFLLPESNLGLFVAYNSVGRQDRTSDAVNALMGAFLQRYYRAPEPSVPRPMPGAAQRVDRFTGHYRYTRGIYSTFEKVSALQQQVQVEAGPNGGLLVTQPQGTPEHWVEVEPLLFQLADGSEPDFRLAFHEDAQGRITYLALGTEISAYERLPWYENATLTYVLVPTSQGVLLSALVGWPIGFLLHRNRQSTPSPRSRTSRVARWVAGMACALGLLFLPALFFFSQTPTFIQEGITPLVIGVLALGLVFAVLAVTTLGFAVRAWARRDWSVAGRVHYTLVALASVAFVWWMHVWNLLGFRY